MCFGRFTFDFVCIKVDWSVLQRYRGLGKTYSTRTTSVRAPIYSGEEAQTREKLCEPWKFCSIALCKLGWNNQELNLEHRCA